MRPDCPVPYAEGWQQPEGSGNLRVLILGDCGGNAEARDGLPFRPYARDGAVLERAIRRCGFSRSQFILWNVVPVSPARGVMEGMPWEDEAVAWGMPLLEDVIAKFKPGAILALGNVSLKAATGLSGEQKATANLRGWPLPSRWGIPVVGSFHPSLLRRGAMSLLSVLMHDLKLAVAVAGGRDTRFYSPVLSRDFEYKHALIPDPMNPVVPPGYVLYPSEHDAYQFLKEMEHDSTRLIAYDIETPRSANATEADTDELGDVNILSIQFSGGAGTGIFLSWQGEFIEIAKRVLALPNPKAGANNWRFDDPLLRAHGCRIGGTNHDVRWAWGHLQPDLRASLQFIASFYCVGRPNWTAWKHCHGSHEAFYGVRDVDAVSCIMEG